MTLTTQDFSMVAGADKELRFTVRDPTTKLVVDLTSYAAEWRAVHQRDPTKTLELAGTIPVPADGVVVVTIDATATDNTDVGRWEHQLWLTDPTLNTDCGASGTFSVRRAIESTGP